MADNRFAKYLPPPPSPAETGGMAKAAGTGIVQGLSDIPGMFGSAGQMSEDVASGLSEWLGLPENVSGYVGKGARWLGGPLFQGPTGEQIVGTVEKATGPLYKPQTPGEQVINSAARFGAGSVVGPGSLPMRVVSGVASGIGSEVAAKAAEGTSLEPAARIAGAVVGGLTPEGVRSGWSAVVQAFRPPNEKAAQIILKRLQESGLTPDDALAAVQRMGPEAMLADISPSMQVATGGAAVADPGAGQIIATRLSDRRKAAPARVSNLLDDAFGPYKGPQDIVDEIARAREPAGPAYELAKTHIVDPENALTTIDGLLKTFGPKSSLGSTLTSIKNQLIDDSGNVIGRGAIVHGVREQLDDEISLAYRQGAGKKAARLREVRDAVDEALKTQIPGFADADKLWTETAKISEAYDYGQTQFLGKGVYPDQSAKTLAGMTDPEFDAARQGVRAKLAMDFSSPIRNPTLPLERSLSGNMNNQKVPQLIGTNRFAALNRGLGNEATYLETSSLGEPSRGSRTQVLNSAKEMFGASGGNSMLGDTAAGAAAGGFIGGVPGAAAGASAGFLGSLRTQVADALKTQAKPQVVQAAAKMLTATGGNVGEAIRLLNSVAASLPKSSVSQRSIRALANALLSYKSGIPSTPQAQ